MKWTRKGSKEEDEMVAQAADEIVKSLCDADFVGKVELHNGRNIRDQITGEQLDEIVRERNLRRMSNRN